MKVNVVSCLILIFLCLCLANGKKLALFGGYGTNSVNVLSLRTDQYSPCMQYDDIPQPYGSVGRVGAHAARWGMNMFIICGGLDSGGPPISSFRDCHILDLIGQGEFGEWSEGPFMNNLTSYGASAISKEGKFYIIGGKYAHYDGPSPTQWVYLDTIQVLDLTYLSSGWKTLSLSLDIENTCSVTDGSSIFILGYTYPRNRIVKFDMDTELWEEIPANLEVEALGAGCALVEEGDHKYIVVAGGAYHPVRAGVIDLENWSWRDLPNLKFDRHNHPVVSQTGGKVVIHGGSHANVPMEVLEIWEEDGGWEEVGEIDEPRVDTTAVLVEDGMFPGC